jgi:hypothetical protein
VEFKPTYVPDGWKPPADAATLLTFREEEPRPVEVGTPVYDSDGRLVARVTAVDPDGTVTIGAPDD